MLVRSSYSLLGKVPRAEAGNSQERKRPNDPRCSCKPCVWRRGGQPVASGELVQRDEAVFVHIQEGKSLLPASWRGPLPLSPHSAPTRPGNPFPIGCQHTPCCSRTRKPRLRPRAPSFNLTPRSRLIIRSTPIWYRRTRAFAFELKIDNGLPPLVCAACKSQNQGSSHEWNVQLLCGATTEMANSHLAVQFGWFGASISDEENLCVRFQKLEIGVQRNDGFDLQASDAHWNPHRVFSRVGGNVEERPASCRRARPNDWRLFVEPLRALYVVRDTVMGWANGPYRFANGRHEVNTLLGTALPEQQCTDKSCHDLQLARANLPARP
mmetsp:Transcript_77083/g.178797  ORF Transcript_77083/g.178797 Transcript_77083/m.178797 type:complete len:324 (-) Transcript_77083:7-978(-)